MSGQQQPTGGLKGQVCRFGYELAAILAPAHIHSRNQSVLLQWF